MSHADSDSMLRAFATHALGTAIAGTLSLHDGRFFLAVALRSRGYGVDMVKAENDSASSDSDDDSDGKVSGVDAARLPIDASALGPRIAIAVRFNTAHGGVKAVRRRRRHGDGANDACSVPQRRQRDRDVRRQVGAHPVGRRVALGARAPAAARTSSPGHRFARAHPRPRPRSSPLPCPARGLRPAAYGKRSPSRAPMASLCASMVSLCTTARLGGGA